MDAVGGFLAAGSACIVPRAFRQLQPGRIFAKQGGNAPLRHRWRDASSLIGEPLGGCRLQSLPCKGRCRRRRRRGAAPCHAFTFTGQQCPHRPANLSAVAMLSGGRNRPPYNARQTAGETGNFAFAADVSFPGTHLRGIVGRAFTPAARPSGCRGVSGPMLGIVPQSCRSPQCLGAHSFFPLPSVYRQVARRAKSPALQCKANGRRNRKLCLCG